MLSPEDAIKEKEAGRRMKRERKNRIKKDSFTDRFLSRQLSSSVFTYREIFSMLIPIVLDQFFCYAVGIVTTALISSSSQESVTAVSLINPIYATVFSAVNAIAAGGTVVVAQYKGRKDEEKTRQAAGQIIFGTVGLAAVVAVLLSVFSSQIVSSLFGTAEELVKIKAQDYLVGMSVSMVMFAVYMAGFSVFRGIGNTGICLILTLVINIIYILGQVLFINILKLDVIGSVIAINIARVIGAAAAMYLLMRPASPLPVKLKDIFKVKVYMLKPILKVGIPYGMEQVFFNGGTVLVQIYMVGLGTAAVASYAVANSALTLLYAAATSAGMLAITICGRCFGAGEKALTKYYGKKMLSMSSILVIVSMVVFCPFMEYILKLYQAPTENLTVIYRLIMISLIPLLIFFPAADTLPNVLRSAGDVTFSSMVSLMTMWVVRVALGYLLGITFGLGVYGIYLAMVSEWAVKTVIYSIRFSGEKWLKKKTIE